MNVVESGNDFDILKERHPEDGKDKHDQKEEHGNVDQRRKRHNQGEEQCPDPLGTLDQPEDSSHLDHTNLIMTKKN